MHPGPLIAIGEEGGIYAYGVCMAVGILLCFGFIMFAMWYKRFNEEATDKILLIGIFGTGFGIFCAMLVQGIYDVIAGKQFTLKGMTFFGGLIGGVVSFLAVWWLYVYVIAPRTKIKLLQNNMNASLSDAIPFIPIGILLAHAFGRLGCLFAGCCYGRETDAWYGMYCAAPYGTTLNVKVVPTQLFEMIFLLVLAAVMALLYFRFKFNCNFGLYGIAYGIWRFVIEFYRADDRGGVQGAALTPSQILSIVLVLIGVGYFFLYKYIFSKCMKHPELKPREGAANKEPKKEQA